MKRASLANAKNRLSAAGDAGRLARLERQGILRPALSPGSAQLSLTPPRARRPVALSQLVITERREGW